jgi:glycerol-3-phosphate dehydrogenase (NAD(P)+)
MKIFIIGAGSFGTAVGNQLVNNGNNEVCLLTRGKKQEDEINNFNTNKTYFQNKILDKNLKATSDVKQLLNGDVIFITIPSSQIENEIKQFYDFINNEALIVNLSKGISKNGETIVSSLMKSLRTENVVTMKGPTFASELINFDHSIFTLGFTTKNQYSVIEKIISNTNIHIDCTTDIVGVEILSALKNIYAILIGVVDAKYNSANTRFMILTKAFSEISILLQELGGRKDSLFLSCGYGDLGLTSLNDLSRNRTLGLLIGKGFYESNIEKNSVVLEGLKTLKIIRNSISQNIIDRLPLFNDIDNFFSQKSSSFNIRFDSLVDKKMKTVITYGTFDLLHYGHLEVLRRARELGDRLIVGISSDEFNKIKGKKSKLDYLKRKELLESIGYVDLVIPETHWEQKMEDVKNNEVDIFVMGDDWQGKFDFLKEHCEVIYLPRTPGISTTKIKTII